MATERELKTVQSYARKDWRGLFEYSLVSPFKNPDQQGSIQGDQSQSGKSIELTFLYASSLWSEFNFLS